MRGFQLGLQILTCFQEIGAVLFPQLQAGVGGSIDTVDQLDSHSEILIFPARFLFKISTEYYVEYPLGLRWTYSTKPRLQRQLYIDFHIGGRCCEYQEVSPHPRPYVYLHQQFGGCGCHAGKKFNLIVFNGLAV